MGGYSTGQRVPADGVNPLAINGCTVWLRADQGISIGTGVQSWQDLSGNGNHVSQATTSKQPAYVASDLAYNGQPTLQFVSANAQGLTGVTTLALAQPMTLLCVGQSDGVVAGWPVQCSGLTAGLMINTSGLFEGYAGTFLSSSTNITTPGALAAILNSTSSSTYINGSTPRTTGNANTGSLTGNLLVGSANGQPINGKIAEVLIYARQLSSAELSQLFKYFATRYNPGAWQ